MDSPKTKWCRVCDKTKNIEEFEPNQYAKNNRIVRRPVCRECYSKKVRVKSADKRLFIQSNPKPEIGHKFTCPICKKSFFRETQNDVVLDHSHITGKIRGWLCNSCNTSIGKFNDDTEVLLNAIEWIKKTS